jgi:6-phosphofructokinase 1
MTMIHIPQLPKKNTHSTQKIQSIAVLCSGGDAPGMNAAVRSVVRYGIASHLEVYGIFKGYSGLLDNKIELLSPSSVANIIQRGGTVLKTSRCPEFFHKKGRKLAASILSEHGIDALVVIGGDGSFRGAYYLENETGIKTIGIPGTIDNDIRGTDETLGFDTAVNTALNAIDRIRDTASSHDRTFIIEVMGHQSGFIAVTTGISGGAETVLVPEHPESIKTICETIKRGQKRGKMSSIIVVAEGPKPGLSERISQQLAHHQLPSKICILGHTQRRGSPTARDRLLGSVMGSAAVSGLLAGKSQCMVGIQKNQITFVPFKGMVKTKKPLERSSIDLARILAT